MFKFLVLLAFIAVAESATRVNVRPCAGNLPVPNWVESEMCTADRCTARRNSVFLARISFTPREVFNRLTVAISATWLGLPFPIAIPPGYEDACDFLEAGARCPVQANTDYVWGLQAPIDGSYPAANGINLQMSAGDGGRTTACGIVTADIV